MDGSTFEHSDSESGDSWTLLEHSPAHGDDAPDFSEHLSESRLENHEKDEDTDGISIISDSEPDSPFPCQLYEHYLPDDNCPTDPETTGSISANQPLIDINDHDESVRAEDDFLDVDNIKHRTYVHRRNKRLSTMLNIIVLGSVITAAGVAIGHMWGAKTDCSMHTTPTVNKILSNLYKLQEENAYLRSKLKEITTLSSYQTNLQKASKQNRCRKMFEESLNNDNIDKLTKCLDNKFNNAEKLLKSHLDDPNYEKEFVSDIDKLKNVYLQNKSWLDEEINHRLKQEEESLKKLKSKHNISKLHKINEEKNTNIIDEPEVMEHSVDKLEIQDESIKNEAPDKIITYADSLKSTEKIKKMIDNIENHKAYKVENKEINDNKILNGDFRPIFDSVSEEELKKDNRYKNQKYKPEKKKHDRQKSHKKQKRKNKYEQWEMKGGFMKDYDEISFASSQDAESINKNVNLKYDIEENIIHPKDNTKFDKHADNVIDMTPESYKTTHDKDFKSVNNNEIDDNSWLEKRATLRTEARKRLEHELFGESPNTAGWYFRRMRKREQCRAKGDNSTYRKLLKRNMNFKTKH